ncbi:MAG: hypothetical protein ACREBO_13820 [Novosphingobium sp.]
MHYRSKILLGAALAAGLTVSAAAKPTPARSAAVWADIEALAAEVNRADVRDTISEREAAGLRGEIGELRAQYRRYNANGLSPAEVGTLEARIRTLRGRLGNERADRDGHRG